MSYIRTYTAQAILTGSQTGGTFQFGGAIDSSSGTPVNGQLMQFQLSQGGMGTALVTQVKTLGQGGPQLTLLNVTGQASDGWYFPRQGVSNTGGTALGTTVVDRFAIDDSVQLIISGGTAGTVTCRMLVFV